MEELEKLRTVKERYFHIYMQASFREFITIKGYDLIIIYSFNFKAVSYCLQFIM